MYKRSIHLFVMLIFLIPFNPSSAGPSADEYEPRLLKIINDYRISESLVPLEFDRHLCALAQDHCDYMEKKSRLSHKHFKKRFKKSGYTLCVENVGYFSSQTPSSQLKGWKNSEGHNLNLLNPEIRFAGIGKSGGYACFIGAGNLKKK